jgi:hypothetical protein
MEEGWRSCANLLLITSTMSGFFVVHKTENAHKFIKAEVTSPSFPLAALVFGVPVSQEDITVFGHEGGITNWASKLGAWRPLGDF